MQKYSKFISLFFFASFNLFAQWDRVQSECASDINLRCKLVTSGVEKDLIFCLKRDSNILVQSCLTYVASWLQAHKPPKVDPTVAPTPVPTATPVVTPVPDTALVRYYSDKTRYDDCIKRWPSMSKSYYVLTKEESCSQYAKVYPTEAIQSCVDDALGKKPHSRDYFLNFKDMAEFCQRNPGMDSDWKKCVLGKVQNGGDVVAAYNKCNPKIKKCMGDLESNKPSGGGAFAQLYYEFCFSYPDDLEMGKCVSEFAHKNTELLKKQDILQDLCHPKARSCASRLLLNHKKKVTTDQLRELGLTCRKAFQEEQSEDWAACTYESHVNFKISISDAGEFCKSTNEKAKECVRNNLKEKIAYKDAISICQMNSKNARDCLYNFFKKKSPMDQVPLVTMSKETAPKYCLLETEEERTCFKEGLLGMSSQDEAAIDLLKDTCHEKSNSYKKCIKDFNDYFQNNLFTNVTKEEGKKICKIPSMEMRLCMLNSIMRTSEYVTPPSFWSKGSTWFPYDKYEKKCLAEFLGSLIKEMKIGTEWPCRYKYFEEKSLWDKGSYCMYNTEAICTAFKESLKSMSNADIQNDCKRYNSNYYKNPETTLGNPFWQVCKDRNLIAP